MNCADPSVKDCVKKVVNLFLLGIVTSRTTAMQYMPTLHDS
jgi:hypothetical protein